MDENVLAAAFGRNKTKSLGRVEKLHGSDGHELSFNHRVTAAPLCRRPWKQRHLGLEGFGSSGALGRVRNTEELRLTGTQEPRQLDVGACGGDYNAT